jgi:secondary thiamine-phosphate synthase enzyme
MKQALKQLHVRTQGQALYDITARIRGWIGEQHLTTGLLTVWCRHTSASLIVQENTDPDVRADLLDFFRRVAPEASNYRHTVEGADDMPAHIKAALTQTSLAIPVDAGQPILGTWQAVYLFEHRTKPQERTIVLHFIGS